MEQAAQAKRQAFNAEAGVPLEDRKTSLNLANIVPKKIDLLAHSATPEMKGNAKQLIYSSNDIAQALKKEADAEIDGAKSVGDVVNTASKYSKRSPKEILDSLVIAPAFNNQAQYEEQKRINEQKNRLKPV